jgi:hypothetical protein
MKLIFISIVQAIYIIYMLNYFKTKYSIAHPLTYFENNLIYHPIGQSDKPISNICKLGHILSWYLGLFVVLRSIFIENNIIDIKYIKIVSLVGLCLGMILSMMNFNAVLYLLPHFLIEFSLIKNSFSV